MSRSVLEEEALVHFFEDLRISGIDLDAKVESNGYTQPLIMLTSEAGYDISTFLFELGTSSRWGHAGILFYDCSKEQWLVAHASPPGAKSQSIQSFLCQYVSISKISKRFEVAIFQLRKHKELSAANLKELTLYLLSLGKTVNIPYNHRFTISGDDTMCCSEFIHKTFRKYGIKAGCVEIPKSSSNVNITATRIPCFGKYLASQLLPLDECVVTPVSIAFSPDLELKCLCVETLEPISEKSVYDAWMNACGSECSGSEMLESLDQLLLIPNCLIKPCLKKTRAISKFSFPYEENDARACTGEETAHSC